MFKGQNLLLPVTCSKLIKPSNFTDSHAQRFGKFLQCNADAVFEIQIWMVGKDNFFWMVESDVIV